jgi:peptidoglycan-associated lipoprotein
VSASSSSAQLTPAATAPQSLDDFTDETGLKDVFFDPGRAAIGHKGTETLKDNARWIKQNPGNLVLIEGHTDYNGTRETNLTMGERRARATVSFLLKEGVRDTRLWTISYGSDRPVCVEKTFACAAKNRRVQFPREETVRLDRDPTAPAPATASSADPATEPPHPYRSAR